MSSRRPGSYGLRGKSLQESEEVALQQADARQCEIDELNERCQDEVAQVERKYNYLKKQHLLSRDAILRNIPGFWLSVFVNHPTISSLMKEEDSLVLTFMYSLEVEDLPEGEIGFNITLRFSENPYLTNEVLIKKISVEDGVLHCESTNILWKDSAKAMSLGQGGFFAWFSGEVGATVDQKRVSIAIAEDLWNNPLKYYSSPTIEIWDEDSQGVLADDTDVLMKEESVPSKLESTISESASVTDHLRNENSFESVGTSGESSTGPVNEAF